MIGYGAMFCTLENFSLGRFYLLLSFLDMFISALFCLFISWTWYHDFVLVFIFVCTYGVRDTLIWYAWLIAIYFC